MPIGQMHVGQMPVIKMLVIKMPVIKMFLGQMPLGQMLISQKMSNPLKAQTVNEYFLIHSLRNRRCFHKNTQNVLNLSTSFSGGLLALAEKTFGRI
jgi:hypothetical protein